MDDQILFQGQGYTIARTFNANTLVPYGPAERPNGNMNYGWIDLRGHPERVGEIPEATKSAGLAKLLRVIAVPVSKVMSGGCECAAFDRGLDFDGPRWLVGGFVDVMFIDAERNVDPQNHVDLAGYILSGIGASDTLIIGYEMIIEPLKTFFGRGDCHALMLKPQGYGPDEATAWAAFDYAAAAAADSLGRDRPAQT